MGIFDHFRSAGQAAGEGNNKADTPEQDALRLIDEGNALEAQGRVDGAMQRYLEAIRLAPNLARAHLNYGNALLTKGDLTGALEAFRTAIKHKPDYAGAYYNMGNALLSYGQHNEAVENYRKALEIKPDYAEVHCALGVALKELGQMDDAVASYRRALEIKHDMPEAHNNLDAAIRDIFTMGNHQMAIGQLDSAAASYLRVIELKPGLVEAHNNLGNTLRVLMQFDSAEASYRQALMHNPDYAEAHNNLGNVLKDMGQLDSAEASYRRALELNPYLAEAHHNLGVVLNDIEQYEEAVENFRHALVIKPDYAEAHINQGLALMDIGQIEAALASYRSALEIKPDYAEAHNNLGIAQQFLGQINYAIESYRRALEIAPNFTAAHSNLLFAMSYFANQLPSYYLEQARRYGQIVAEKVRVRFSDWQCDPQPNHLRVGLVSGDLRIHSVGYFLEGLLSHIDSSRIELIAYPTYHKEDELTARIRPRFSAWKSLTGKSDEAAAQLIQADGVHILIDISGHTAHNRLTVFAWKPAPVQVTWLGLPNTTGVSEMDYVLGDLQAIPPEHENHFSEAVWRLPDSYVCFTAPGYPVKVAPLPALTSGYVTFGSFNNLTKMNDAVVDLWARILLLVPNARLYLKAGQLNDQGICKLTRQRFAARGIASERLLLGGTLGSVSDHLSEYNKIDIALDTFPYPGVTTSVEALWMAVPVLTLHGDRFLSLSAKSIAHHAGLPDWIAANDGDYIAKAVAFSANLADLAKLRLGLRAQVLASPLFDTPRFARNFEDALWGMWQAYQARER